MTPSLGHIFLSLPAIAAFHLVFVMSTLAGSAYAVCYYPDGTVAVDTFPCFPDQAASLCCGSNWVCSTNLLCLGTSLIPAYAHLVARGSCTDQSWRSTACPRFCTDNRTWLLCAIPKGCKRTSSFPLQLLTAVLLFTNSCQFRRSAQRLRHE